MCPLQSEHQAMILAIAKRAGSWSSRGRTNRARGVQHLLAIAFACGWISGCGSSDPAATDRIVTDFASRTYDRSIFRAQGAPRGPAWGRWEFTGAGLRAFRPPGELDRPPLQFLGRFELEGDFEVTAQFTIGRLPQPKTKQGSNRIAILLHGPDRFASLFRAATRAGNEYGYDVDGSEGRPETGSVPTRRTAQGGTTGRSGSRARPGWRC
jgi:hypothetical protein